MKVAEDTAYLAMPGHLLRRCHQIGVAIFLDECRAMDLTPLQYSVLAALDRFGSLDQASLGGATALDRTTIVVVLAKLIERGLVSREHSSRDRRSKIVALTPAGGGLLRRALPSVRAVQERLLAPLSDEEQAELARLLSKVAEANNAESRAPYRLPRG